MRSLQGGWPACASQALGQEGVSAHLALSGRFCTAKHSCSCSLLRDLLPATCCPKKHTSLGQGVSVYLLSGTGAAQGDLMYNRNLKSGFSFRFINHSYLQCKMGHISMHKPVIKMKYSFFNK